MASLATVESAIGRLHCISTTIELIQAQAKEARLSLHQYQDKGSFFHCINYLFTNKPVKLVKKNI